MGFWPGQKLPVTGVGIAPEMLSEAPHADAATGPEIAYRVAPAEKTGLPGNAWDVVCAGRCWHVLASVHSQVAESRRDASPLHDAQDRPA